MGWFDEMINRNGLTNGDLLLQDIERLTDAIMELNATLVEIKELGK